MARKQIKIKRAVRAPETNVVARKVWLAGLGAVSLTRKQAIKLADTLVSEGEEFKARSEEIAENFVKDARRAALNLRKRVEGVVTPIRARAEMAVKQVEAGLGQGLDQAQVLLSRVTDRLRKTGFNVPGFAKPTRKTMRKTMRKATRAIKRKRAA
jgi:polyhydroxyalkanoate synthesis regulator phasin